MSTPTPEALEQRLEKTEAILDEARKQATQNAQELAVYASMQREQAKSISTMIGAQSQMLVSVTKVGSSIEWIREELATKVDDASVAAQLAKQEAIAAREAAINAEAATGKSEYAQVVSIIAMLIALLGGVLGVTGLPNL